MPGKMVQERAGSHVIQLERDASRGPAEVDVKSTEHARDHDRLGRVGSDRGRRGYALAQPLVRPLSLK
jgi:hypothetical protein